MSGPSAELDGILKRRRQRVERDIQADEESNGAAYRLQGVRGQRGRGVSCNGATDIARLPKLTSNFSQGSVDRPQSQNSTTTEVRGRGRRTASDDDRQISIDASHNPAMYNNTLVKNRSRLYRADGRSLRKPPPTPPSSLSAPPDENSGAAKPISFLYRSISSCKVGDILAVENIEELSNEMSAFKLDNMGINESTDIVRDVTTRVDLEQTDENDTEDFGFDDRCKHRRRISTGEAVNENVMAVDRRSKSARKLLELINELLHTEEVYCDKLRHLVHDYIGSLHRENAPPALRYFREDIFGNCEELYDFHSNTFLPALQAAGADPGSVAAVFLDHAEQFILYVTFSKKNKKAAKFASDYKDFFSVIQRECNKRLDVCSFLVEPIQRVPRYEMLLRGMAEACARLGAEDGFGSGVSGALESALSNIRSLLRKVNDAVAVENIADAPIELHEQGDLLRQQEFSVTDPLKKVAPMRCFLFEKALVFTAARDGDDLYRARIDVRDLGVTTARASAGRLCVWRGRRDVSSYALCGSPSDCEAWAADISVLLWREAKLAKEKSLRRRTAAGASGAGTSRTGSRGPRVPAPACPPSS